MPELRVDLDRDTADALQSESELLGFDGPESYLAWIVENRAAIEQGTESAELLDAYRRRLAALEERLAAIGVDPEDVYADDERTTDDDAAVAERADASGSVATATDGSDSVTSAADASDSAATAADATESVTTAADASDPVASAADDAADADESADRAVAAATTGGTSGPNASETAAAVEPEPVAAESSDPRDVTSTTQSTLDADRSDDASSSESGSAPSSVTDVEITSMHLSPGVQRVDGDTVGEEAGQLKTVETKRVDELSRRAVAKTRSQLDRDVETGLSYSSSPAVDSDVRPGEDLADLDAIDVPGRSEDVVAERREVVGRALAFLRDEERARRSAFVDALYEDHPVGYETEDGWWRCVREGLEQVDAVDGGHVWEYVG